MEDQRLRDQRPAFLQFILFIVILLLTIYGCFLVMQVRAIGLRYFFEAVGVGVGIFASACLGLGAWLCFDRYYKKKNQQASGESIDNTLLVIAGLLYSLAIIFEVFLIIYSYDEVYLTYHRPLW